MQEEFNIVFMAKYVKEEQFTELLEHIPNSSQFHNVAITNK